MSDPTRSSLRGTILALMAFATFSTHDVVVKYLGGFYSTFQILFFSVLLSFPLATMMLLRDATSGNLRPVHPGWSALRTVASVSTGLSAFYAFSVLPMAQVYAIIFAAPLLVTVLSIPILGERVGRHRWLAVLLGLIGVLVVLRPGVTPIGLGHLAALVAAVGSATAAVVVRKIGKDERAVVLMLYPMMVSVLLMGVLMPAHYVPMPIGHLGLLGVISVLGFTSGLLLIGAYRAGDAAVVAPMQYSQILWAVIYGAFLFNERPDLPTVAGASLVIASGVYIVLRESIRGPSRNRPVQGMRSRQDSWFSLRAVARAGRKPLI